MRNEDPLAALRRQFTQRLADLDALATASADARRPVTLDQQSVGRLSRMDAMQVQAMALATEERRNQERKRLTSAIARIEDGTYGDCVRCGAEIAPARLTADPATPLCVGCARGPG